MTSVTSPIPSIKEEPRLKNNPLPTQKEKVWMGTKLPLLQISRKGRRRLGWQLPKTVAAANNTPTEDSDAPSKMPLDFNLPETPELSETQPGVVR